MDEKRKKKLEEVAQYGSTNTVIDPSSPIRRRVKWKIARTKKTRQMTSEAAEKLLRRLIRWRSRPHRVPLSPMDVRITKENCVDTSRNDPDTGDSDKYRLYIKENPPCLVALGRVYEGSTTVHNIPLLHDQVKVGVEEVGDADSPIPIPTKLVKLLGQTLNTFLAWSTHLVKHLSKQVMWNATVFGVFNENFPLYIKHEDLPGIALSGQCLIISVIQLWILHMTETSMRVGNVDVYGFLKPQS
ncbi:hypothetical protein HKD37_15G043068 [Glycine soja]